MPKEIGIARIKEDYWKTVMSQHEKNALCDVLLEFYPDNCAVTDAQHLFMQLPLDIVGLGIAWGFDDTEVREKAYNFISDGQYKKEKM